MSEKLPPMSLPIHGRAKHDQTVCIDIYTVVTPVTFSSGSTVYMSFGGYTGSAEGLTQFTVPQNGYFQNLRAISSANGLTTGSLAGTSTLTFRTGSGASPLNVVFSAGTTGSGADTTDVVFTPAGTLVDIQNVCSASSGSITYSVISVEYWS